MNTSKVQPTDEQKKKCPHCGGEMKTIQRYEFNTFRKYTTCTKCNRRWWG